MKRQTSRGYTLIELALAMVVLGLVMVVVWRFGVTANQRMVEIEAPPALAAADQALIGYAAVQSRLPCPDTTGDGREDCAGNPVGRLPVVTLGLVRSDLANVRYGVFRAAQALTEAGQPRQDADLAASPAKDRFAPLIATAYPVVVLTPSPLLGNVNGIDFCAALRSGGALPANNARLHIQDGAGTMIKNVAYALALPGALDADNNGSGFDAPNASATGFASPARPIGTAYDDGVLAVDFSQMFTRMACAGVLAAASHAHANAASSAAILYSAFRDYDVQLRLADEMAQAKVSSAIAGTFSAAAGVPKAGATIALAIANSLLTAGAATPTIAVAATAVAFNAAAVVSAGIALGLANDAKVVSAQRILDFAPLLSDSQALSASIFTHALAADAAGIY
jgi:prepilin-type N-terminal cleavage/methylation domain-containing protein